MTRTYADTVVCRHCLRLLDVASLKSLKLCRRLLTAVLLDAIHCVIINNFHFVLKYCNVFRVTETHNDVPVDVDQYCHLLSS